jgi:regulator of cell morphogenesis and NO signaling
MEIRLRQNDVSAKLSTMLSQANDNQEQLSEREKEVVIGVVQGMTNKEIADQLFISTNTVITHRKNIAKKLQIHSAAGLTIFAIVNKLVDISKVKL